MKEPGASAWRHTMVFVPGLARLKPYFQSGLALLSGTVLARLLMAATLILTARQIGPEANGAFSAALALARVSAVAFTLGLDVWILRNGLLHGLRSQLSESVTGGLSIKVALALPWLLLLIVLSATLLRVSVPLPVLLLVALGVLIEELLNSFITGFKTALRNRVTFMLLLVYSGLLFGTAAAISLAGNHELMPLLAARIFAGCVAAGVAMITFIRWIGWRWNAGTGRRMLHDAPPYASAAFFGQINGQADIVLVAIIVGSYAAGIYAPAVAILNAFFLLPAALFDVLVPVLSSHWQLQIRRNKTLYVNVIGASFAVGVVAALMLALLADPFVSAVFGPRYAATGVLLQIMSAILAIRFVTYPLAAWLTSANLQSQRAVALGAVAGLTVVLNILVLPVWGLMGAAATYLFCELVLMAWYALLFARSSEPSAGAPGRTL